MNDMLHCNNHFLFHLINTLNFLELLMSIAHPIDLSKESALLHADSPSALSIKVPPVSFDSLSVVISSGLSNLLAAKKSGADKPLALKFSVNLILAP